MTNSHKFLIHIKISLYGKILNFALKFDLQCRIILCVELRFLHIDSRHNAKIDSDSVSSHSFALNIFQAQQSCEQWQI